MKISFVICCCKERLDNLRQMLQLLAQREDLQQHEVCIVCQNEIPQTVEGHTPFNLKLPSYNKGVMCNFGVRQARNEIVALLDCDRILPAGYFQRVAAELQPGDFVSTYKMYRVPVGYTNEELQRVNPQKLRKDFKHKNNKLFGKNLFSGHTVFFKQEYLELGGMDEAYNGYGFVDNDMTNIVMPHKRIVWREDVELHLFHEPYVNFQDAYCRKALKLFTCYNALRYHRKWQIPVTEELQQRILVVREGFYRLPRVLQEQQIFAEFSTPKFI